VKESNNLHYKHISGKYQSQSSNEQSLQKMVKYV